MSGFLSTFFSPLIMYFMFGSVYMWNLCWSFNQILSSQPVQLHTDADLFEKFPWCFQGYFKTDIQVAN